MKNLRKVRSLPPPVRYRSGRVGMMRVALIVWIALVTAGFVTLVVYERSPGADGIPSQTISLNLERETWTLLVGVHPRCPCTRATVDELEWLLYRNRKILKCNALIYHPEGFEKEWMELPLVARLKNMPGVTLRGDSDGRELARLGIETSGGIRLFDPRGKLCFQGGITPSRGHRGLNLGSEIIESLLRGEPTPLNNAPVYGCSTRCSSMKDK